MKREMFCWPLYGAGFENLGENGEPCVWPVEAPGEDQLLVRIEAIGLCFSDVKLVRAGEEHPRVRSDNLAEKPVIPGHEAVMTVVEAGQKVAQDYPVGSRYIIQADIYVNGEGWAYGYAINGGMAQYSLIDQRVLNGDEGSYLLPIQSSTPATLAALIEPWTCVIASYMMDYRTAPQHDGYMLVASGGNDAEEGFTFDGLGESSPAEIDCLNLNDATLTNLTRNFPDAKINVLSSSPEEACYTDIILCNMYERDKGEAFAKLGRGNAVISFLGGAPDEDWSFDVGSIHYKGWFYQGSQTREAGNAYGRNVRSELKQDGCCWFAGGAGAMGQMHVQRAIDAGLPSKVLVTDLDDERLAALERKVAGKAAEKNIEIKCVNPQSFSSQEEYDEMVSGFAPGGYDDIVMLVPVTQLVNDAERFLAEEGVMNIFAGIPAGKEASLNIRDIVEKDVRFIGSSGSRTYHLRHTLSLVEKGELQPAAALAAIGGMKTLWEGLQGVAEAKYPGKTVVLPQCEDMPLVSVSDLAALNEELSSTLDSDGCFTLETEKKLLELYGAESES